MGLVKWKNHKVFGVGINDLDSKHPAYPTWHSIHRRSYSEVYHASKPTYEDVEVCSEWQIISNYAGWFLENYVEGFQLDKDLIKPGNRIYCPEFCCFLPNEVNCALQNNRGRNGLPPGVSIKAESGKYIAQLSMNTDGRRVSKHLLSTDSVQFAAEAYKVAKEEHISKLADKWKDSVSQQAYDSLKAYEVVWN